jgi:hypothetical protein
VDRQILTSFFDELEKVALSSKLLDRAAHVAEHIGHMERQGRGIFAGLNPEVRRYTRQSKLFHGASNKAARKEILRYQRDKFPWPRGFAFSDEPLR